MQILQKKLCTTSKCDPPPIPPSLNNPQWRKEKTSIIPGLTSCSKLHLWAWCDFVGWTLPMGVGGKSGRHFSCEWSVKFVQRLCHSCSTSVQKTLLRRLGFQPACDGRKWIALEQEVDWKLSFYKRYARTFPKVQMGVRETVCVSACLCADVCECIVCLC